jgi:hypothetical protein
MRRSSASCGVVILVVLILGSLAVKADDPPGPGDNVMVVSSTVPANGDLNPYGVARVPDTKGILHAGNILVSNFNNSANLQGTGSTIVQISPKGFMSLFAQIDATRLPGPCPGGVGLTTALVVLRSGWVIVGSLPTTDGTAATAQSGCLIVLDSTGKPVKTISGSLISGPWDMTSVEADHTATLFVTNVLNGTVAAGGKVVNQGTVVRINLNTGMGSMPQVGSMTVIGSGFSERTDPAALVIGPTGVGLSDNGVLYVADSLNNRIAAIPSALTRQSSAGSGTTVSANGTLNDPLGLADGHQGNIVTVNGNDGFLVVTRPDGNQIFTRLLDSSGNPPGSGALFGLAFAPQGLFFVDDATNTLNVLR